MAFSFYEINTQLATEGEFPWRMKEALVAAGAMAVARSGDATTFNGSGDVHAPGGPYAGSLDITNAWFEIRQPVTVTPRRSLLFQKTSTVGAWRCWYSSGGDGFKWGVTGTGDSFSIPVAGTARITDAAGLFVVGDVGKTIRITGATSAANNGDFVITAYVSATQIEWANAGVVAEAFAGNWYIDRPATASVRGIASDEQGVFNTPSGTSRWMPSSMVRTSRMAVIVGGLAEEYSFYAFLWSNAANMATEGVITAIGLDVCDQTHASDPDHAVVHSIMQLDAATTAGGYTLSHISMQTAVPTITQSRMFGWFNKGGAGANYVSYPFVFMGNEEGFIGTLEPVTEAMGSRASDNAFSEIPVWYWRGSSSQTTERGRKGRSRIFRGIRSSLGGFRLNNTRTRIGFHFVSLPWDGTTVPRFGS